ncbi:hypothetical protein KIH39_10015 [Telmatocola sphagniphila]|uniref:Uncharacterized protein n=1 Tax=Telmatocola sphagniphila TaxID=1123043 RepID=A0A8E6BBQ4_9BACT|nr:hypothetical protein [Telmatocola sphagniphila]QVL34218.1 hypothetical protein KIH39_10015 [Telmatocola sphagniphila]
MALAANGAGRQILILTAQIALLEAVRRNPSRCTTTDDITADLMAKHSDGGRWRGTVPRSLAVAGLIKKIGTVNSSRAARHSGYLAQWQGVSDSAIDAHLVTLRRELNELKTQSSSADAGLFAGFETESGRTVAPADPMIKE